VRRVRASREKIGEWAVAMRAFYEGYELCDDASRISRETVFRWLHEDAYWSKGNAREMIERSIDHSFLYGVLDPDGATVGCARVVTDQATFAWVSDVFVDPEHRGVGLGTWMVDLVVEDWLQIGVSRVLLVTRDAHQVYSKVGFRPLEHPERFMEIDRRTQR
jgi:N-acetylglutamate synthase-like GNAT family acetyltransferase